MNKRVITLLAFLCLMSAAVFGDEGMWLFNAAPTAKIKAKYGFEPSQQWLDHLRVGSVRFNNGGSGSFVSRDGLVFTNHHVGRVCLQQLSTPQKDYIKDGFYAKTQAEEGKCPDLELNVLMGIEDVTAKVQGAAKSGLSSAEAGAAMRQTIAQLESDCATKSGLRCDVVTLYSGGMYHLYKYKKYTDVRVVMAPDAAIAFFGGDPDNFEYPRYDLDITYFRVYENGKKVDLGKNFLRWSNTGVKEGDLVFVSGHPGGTDRMLTVAELKFLRDVTIPMTLERLTRRQQLLKQFAAQSEENARIAGDDIFGVENSLKVYRGRRDGLNDSKLMDKKEREENQLRDKVNADPKLKSQYGDAWENIANATNAQRELAAPYTFLERGTAFVGSLASYARTLVRVTAEREKSANERLREYGDARIASIEQKLFSTAPVYKTLEEAELANSLEMMQEKLGANHPVVQKVLNGRTPAAVAKEAVQGTKLDDPAFRRELYKGGAKAVEASNDPMIVLMRSVDADARAVRKQYEDQVESATRANTTKVAKARFAVLGTDSAPDATFTLRLSYGPIKGYEGVPAFTNMGGAFDHAEKHGNKEPYELPRSWHTAKPKMKLETPYNFISTSDIIGGNSGSPTVNKKGEVVGIVFDMNMPSLVWNFAYDDREGRCVHVDSRAIIESLRTIYNAPELADELQGGTIKGTAKAVSAK